MLTRSKLAALLLLALAPLMLVACGGGGGSGSGSSSGSSSSSSSSGGTPPPPTVDTTPPTTTIDFQPAIITADNNALFMFSSSETGATYEASLDGGPFVPANTVPYELTGLAEGLHFLAVRARDVAGNVDATPATAQWLIQAPPVDNIAPTTTIDAQPAPVSASDSAVFIFSSSELSTYECSVDSAAFASCPQFFTLTSLADGVHNLAVRARDAAGNADESPATAQWIVSNPGPNTILFAGPDWVTRSTSASFSFGPIEAGGSFEGSLDGAAFTAVTPGVTFNSLGQGTHTFTVRARNAAGIADPTPATHTWAVDRVAPTARIAFPTAVGYTSASTLTVRGNANDGHGVLEVLVNGVPATTIDNFETWRAEVPLVTGTNSITVKVTDFAGNVANSAASASITHKGHPIYSARGIDFDPNGNQLIVGDRSLNVIYAVSLDEGVTRVVSPAPASPLYRLSDLTVDPPRNRAIVVESYLDALVAVDLTTGVRTVVAPASQSSSTTRFTDSAVIAVDTANNRAFVTRPSSLSVIGVDLATGVRTIVTSTSVGTGDDLSGGAGIVYDDISNPGTPRLLVSEGSSGSDRIVAVDVATGDRTVFSSFAESVGSGAFVYRPGALKLDIANNRVLVLDADARQIVGVDLATGNRTQFTGDTVQPRLNTTRGMAFVPSGSRVLVAKEGGIILSIDGASQRSTLVSNAVGTGAAINYAESVVIEQGSGTPASLLFTDAGMGSLTRLDLTTGARSVVSSSTLNVGSGADLVGIVSAVRDTRTQGSANIVFALVGAPNYSLVGIDLITGNRTFLTDLNWWSVGVPATPALSNPRSMRLDAANGRLYFSDTTGGAASEALYAINFQDLTRSTVTSATRGAGPSFNRASTFVLDYSGLQPRALVADEGPGGMLAVDLATGNRTVFLEPWAEDPEPGASVASATFLDAQSSRLIATRLGSTSNLFAISMTTGQQQILSGEDPVAGTVVGRGPTPYGATALDVNIEDGVAFTGNAWIGAIFAVDLISGDRVMIAR